MNHDAVKYLMRALGEAVGDFRVADGTIDHARAEADLAHALTRPGRTWAAPHVTYARIAADAVTLVYDDGDQRFIHEVTPRHRRALSAWIYGAPGTAEVVANRSLPAEDQIPVAPLLGQITRAEWLETQ